jgi:hypothetical protein
MNAISWFITSQPALLQRRVRKRDCKIRKWKAAAYTTRRETVSSDKSRRHPQNVNVTHEQLRCVCTHSRQTPGSEGYIHAPADLLRYPTNSRSGRLKSRYRHLGRQQLPFTLPGIQSHPNCPPDSPLYFAAAKQRRNDGSGEDAQPAVRKRHSRQ